MWERVCVRVRKMHNRLSKLDLKKEEKTRRFYMVKQEGGCKIYRDFGVTAAKGAPRPSNTDW